MNVLCINPKCTDPDNRFKDTRCKSCNSPLFLNNRFYALKMLGKGAFGRTYLALDDSKFQKNEYPFVVLKMFYSDHSSEKAIDLFKGEAKQLKALSNRSIPAYVDDFEEEHRLFLVQEHIEGQDLKAICQRKGCFSEDEVLIFLQQMVPVLNYIHENNIIHRDIKPENIMLRRRDMSYVLVDFGASHWRQEQEQGGGPKTGNILDDYDDDGTIVGTPGFIAPEVLNGERHPMCDVYSLGVTAIYLLTGVNPARIRGGAKNWKDALDMIDDMLVDNPERRQAPTFTGEAPRLKTSIEHPPVKGVSWTSDALAPLNEYIAQGRQQGSFPINQYRLLLVTTFLFLMAVISLLKPKSFSNFLLKLLLTVLWAGAVYVCYQALPSDEQDQGHPGMSSSESDGPITSVCTLKKTGNNSISKHIIGRKSPKLASGSKTPEQDKVSEIVGKTALQTKIQEKRKTKPE
ncbi:putative serine/threonine protein kinase [Blattamonas nauphoetae]|uniref:non-specific serine/threonine protein kinase n=1 Tax=Blattamonas nauphoetae TaxID=2049346 RepID=A0ABQ9YK24_9EUKA|nr:putative serine/threonine protein kinase [Blattamonas nauphoetae]